MSKTFREALTTILTRRTLFSLLFPIPTTVNNNYKLSVRNDDEEKVTKNKNNNIDESVFIIRNDNKSYSSKNTLRQDICHSVSTNDHDNDLDDIIIVADDGVGPRSRTDDNENIRDNRGSTAESRSTTGRRYSLIYEIPKKSMLTEKILSWSSVFECSKWLRTKDNRIYKLYFDKSHVYRHLSFIFLWFIIDKLSNANIQKHYAVMSQPKLLHPQPSHAKSPPNLTNHHRLPNNRRHRLLKHRKTLRTTSMQQLNQSIRRSTTTLFIRNSRCTPQYHSIFTVN